VPRTLCDARVAALAEEKTARRGLVGDDDPLDILVLTEKDFTHGNILVQARPIGGLGMLDGAEVDDKIVAVMVKDAVYGGVEDIAHLPSLLVDRLKHYFLTYKQAPADAHPACELTRVYGRDEAFEVIRRSQADYRARFGETLGPILDKG
jgi:inorganic pyrophosphatase